MLKFNEENQQKAEAMAAKARDGELKPQQGTVPKSRLPKGTIVAKKSFSSICLIL